MTRKIVLSILVWISLSCASLVGAGLRGAGAATPQMNSAAATPQLDFEYFKARVLPIFLLKRPGHARCVTCHSINRAALNVVPLSPGARSWNEEQSRQNFELVKRVAFPGDLQSPILIHPLAEDAGGDFFHSGGKHFSSQDDPEWLTLRAFVLGERLKRDQ